MPEEVPIIAAGVASRAQALHWYYALPACLVGALLGDSLMYAIGYFFGEKVLKEHPVWAGFLTPERERKIEIAKDFTPRRKDTFRESRIEQHADHDSLENNERSRRHALLEDTVIEGRDVLGEHYDASFGNIAFRRWNVATVWPGSLCSHS